MGQQQLILLVLATVIVGIAIVVGIRAFTENSAKANADAMIHDAVRMASDIQAWVKKPVPFGGAEDDEDVTNATLADIGLASPYVNLNGSFAVSGGVITGTNTVENNIIEVTIDETVDNGLSDASISGQILCLGGEPVVTDGCGTD